MRTQDNPVREISVAYGLLLYMTSKRLKVKRQKERKCDPDNGQTEKYFAVPYLPLSFLDRIYSNHNSCPEFGKGVLQFLIILPVNQRQGITAMPYHISFFIYICMYFNHLGHSIWLYLIAFKNKQTELLS